MASEETELRASVVYRKGPLTAEDYDEAIEDLQRAKQQLTPDANLCAVCEDSGHCASECHHNPLLLARQWVKSTRIHRCYHCGYVAYTDDQAKAHFGYDDFERPACLERLARLREAETSDIP